MKKEEAWNQYGQEVLDEAIEIYEFTLPANIWPEEDYLMNNPGLDTTRMFWEDLTDEEQRSFLRQAYEMVEGRNHPNPNPLFFPMDHHIPLYNKDGQLVASICHCSVDSMRTVPIYDIAGPKGECLLHNITKETVEDLLKIGFKAEKWG